MKRKNSLSRRLLCLLPALLVPVLVACEAVLDFDRTPLQPVLEASVDSGSSSSDGSKSDAKSSSSSSSSGGGTSTSSSSSSGGGTQDAGSDAEAGSGS